MLEEQIKKLATNLYGYENLEVTATMQYFDNGPYKAGMWIAFVSRTVEDCPNELARDLDTGWGMNEAGALKNLRDRLMRVLNKEIEYRTENMLRMEKANRVLEQLLELQKEVTKTL